jgi:hypothetical protein
MYEAWVDRPVSGGNVDSVSRDYTTFALTSKGVQAVESTRKAEQQ